ncbi:MAG TPA: SpoIIE family protein phosphatase [Tepidisphaeraceae bacterium]|nr:SpoIIE family protein phosphatase [Tepidisphaeraceae bacterium]
MRLSIRWKFILSIGITLLVTYLGLLWWDYSRGKELATQQMQQTVTELAQSRANWLNERFTSVEVVTAAVAGVIERNPPGSPEQLLATWNRAHPALQPDSFLFVVFDPQFASSAGLPAAYRVQGGGGGGGRGGPLRDFVEARRGGAGQGRGGPGRGVFSATVPQILPFALFDYSDPSYARAVEERKPVWCDPHLIRGMQIPRATYSVPIISGDKVIGVVGSLANTNLPRADVGPMGNRGRGPGGPRGDGPPGEAPPPGEGFGPGPSTGPTTIPYLLQNGAVREFTMIGSSGKIISPPSSARDAGPSIIEWAKANNYPDLAENLQSSLEGENTAIHVHLVHDVPGLIPETMAGENYWVAFAPIAATDWVVTAAIAEPSVMTPTIARLRDRAFYLLGGLVLLLIVTTLVSIRVSRPIEKLAGAVQQLAAGNLDAQVRGVSSRDELGQLAYAFNTMTHQLKAHVAALTEQTAARQNVESELRIARQIQTDLLPRQFPQRSEFDLYALNVPAKKVAGDFYDFFFTPDDKLMIAIADVAGKGMPAALVMAVTRTIIRNLATEGMSPRQIAERANAMLVQDSADSMFVTMFLAQYDTKTGEIAYVNAGHPRPYLFSPGQPPRQFGEVTGALLGVNPVGDDWQFEERKDKIEPGQTLVLYTDGVTEARAPSNEMLRDSGLEKLLTKYSQYPVEGICAKLVEELNKYQNGQQSDDITLVAIRRNS